MGSSHDEKRRNWCQSRGKREHSYRQRNRWLVQGSRIGLVPVRPMGSYEDTCYTELRWLFAHVMKIGA